MVYFVVIWYICLLFGMLQQEKSGNPGPGEAFLPSSWLSFAEEDFSK
jgi:hypothetical protein